MRRNTLFVCLQINILYKIANVDKLQADGGICILDASPDIDCKIPIDEALFLTKT